MSAQENREKWVAALRSGEFKQGSTALHPEEDTYCCLGVACELYRRETGEGEWVEGKPNEDLYEFVIDGDREVAFLPCRVQHWLGVVNRRGSLRAHESFLSLTGMNDSSSSTFDQIADTIENGDVCVTD